MFPRQCIMGARLPVLSKFPDEENGRYMPCQTLLQCRAGATIQRKKILPQNTFTSAQVGTSNGEPRYPVIWFQSRVIGNRSIPDVAPNTWFTVTFLGIIQVIHAKVVRPVNRKPGTNWYAAPQATTMEKNPMRLIFQPLISFLCEDDDDDGAFFS